MIWHLLRIVWHRRRLNGLLMAEVLVSFLVLFGVVTAALLFADHYRKPLGFRYGDVWDVRMEQGAREELAATEEHAAALTALLRETRSSPEALAVAAADAVPYDGSTTIHRVEADGRTLDIQTSGVGQEFAEVVRLDLVSGRWFEEADLALDWEPLVINQRLARELFGDGEVVGRKAPFELENREGRVIGVILDYRKGGEFSPPVNFMFRLITTASSAGRAATHLLIRVAPGTPAAAEEKVLARLQRVAPGYSFELRTLERMRETDLRLRMAPLLVAGVVALFLMLMVGLGLIGVLWQNVTQRTREIGLRRAAGASGAQIRRQVLGEVWLLTALGVGAGLLLVLQLPLLDLVAFLPARVLAAGVIVSAVLILALATLSGAYPSWLATRVHPAEALHYE